MEADLSAYHGIDLRDLWRYEEVLLADGTRIRARKLTLRMIFARIRHGLPPESALAIHYNGGKWPWKLQDHLIADVFHALEVARLGRKAKDHPSRPKLTKASQVSPERGRRMRDAQRRAAQERAERNRRRATGGD